MNCCDEYGNCNQGRDCPDRAAQTPPTPQDLTLRDHAVILTLLVVGCTVGVALALIVVTALHRWLA